MKTVMVTGPGRTEVVEVPTPSAGPTDVLVRMRACSICGSDSFYIARGGIPPREGATPLGHEPAGEVVEVGERVEGLRPGDHVVINPIAAEIRRAEARSQEALTVAIRAGLRAITAADARGWFSHAGYRLQAQLV